MNFLEKYPCVQNYTKKNGKFLIKQNFKCLLKIEDLFYVDFFSLLFLWKPLFKMSLKNRGHIISDFFSASYYDENNSIKEYDYDLDDIIWLITLASENRQRIKKNVG